MQVAFLETGKFAEMDIDQGDQDMTYMGQIQPTELSHTACETPPGSGSLMLGE